jgi:hypothetical protein
LPGAAWAIRPGARILLSPVRRPSKIYERQS